MEQRSVNSVIGENLGLKEPKFRLSEDQKEKLKTSAEVALVLVGVAGVIALSVVTPNIFIAIDKLFLKKHRYKKFTKKEYTRRLAKTFYYMKTKGLIEMKPNGKDFLLKLTRSGRKRFKKLNFATLSVAKPDVWNGRWWQVAADIPTEEYKAEADMFREKLKAMNFFPLQRTLWFYPHDPREELQLLVDHFGIGEFVTVMEIFRLDKSDEKRMVDFFKDIKIV